MPEVRGWLHDHEASRLRLMAAGKVVLEIGSYCGKSTIAMAATAKTVYALDWHRGDPSTQLNEGLSGWASVENTLVEFWQNLGDAKVRNVVPLVGKTGQLMTALEKGLADLTFVDGAHDASSASLDILLAKRCTRPGGTIVLHDWDRETVQAAAAMHFDEQPQTDGDRMAWFTLPIEEAPMKAEQTTASVTTDDLAQQLASLDQQLAAAQQAKRAAEDTIAGVHGAITIVRHLAAKIKMKEMTAAANQTADGKPTS